MRIEKLNKAAGDGLEDLRVCFGENMSKIIERVRARQRAAERRALDAMREQAFQAAKLKQFKTSEIFASNPLWRTAVYQIENTKK